MKGIFEELAEANNGIEIENELKDKLLKEIDTHKNEEGYYTDAFGNPISFNGIRQLKRPYTKLNLNEYQQKEIAKCQEDYFYFRKNYCKIVTKKGIGRPEPRDYQKRLEESLVTGEDVIAFWPRQCISGDTLININNKNISIKDFYIKEKEKNKKNIIKDDLFISSFLTNEYIETNKGNFNLVAVHKTIPLKKYKIILDNNLTLEGAENHTIITEDYNEISLRNSLGSKIITKKGISEVVKVIDLEIEENMYDLSIDSDDELYYSNDILSHNSGKSVTISTYLLWRAITKENINIGIAANVQKLAVEVLDKIKKIYIELPIWLQPGLISWNKQSVEFDNGTKLLTAATNGDSFRGYSIHILYVDEVAFIRPSIWEEFADSVFPAQDALAEKQTILSSTAGGLNHFYFMVEGARKEVVNEAEETDIVVLESGEEITVKEYYERKQKENSN